MLEFISEVLGGIRIIFSFSASAAFIGYFIHRVWPFKWVEIIAYLMTISSFLLGIYITYRVSKGKGTMWFLSRVMANPELDDKEELKNNG